MIHDFLNDNDDLKVILLKIIELTTLDGINSKAKIKEQAKEGLKIVEGKR